MKKFFKYLATLSMGALLLTACGTDSEDTPTEDTSDADDKLEVVTSFTILSDMAREIGGDDVSVHNLVPTGTDPHEYEPLPKDMAAVSDADALFYNGLNLEGGEDGWFFRMIDSAEQDEENVYNLSEGVEPLYLTDDLNEEMSQTPELENVEGDISPQAFSSPHVGIIQAENTLDALIEKDPENAEAYKERGEKYLDKLHELDDKYRELINDIPEENRVIVTSERAFQYVAKEYGLKEGFIYAIDTEDDGSPEQMKSLVKFIENNNVPVLFIESNVDERPMETVSDQTGVPFSDKPIFSDEIDEPGGEVDTYLKYLDYNIELIHDELKDAE